MIRNVASSGLTRTIAAALLVACCGASTASAGEPAREFLVLLREAGYFDTAQAYLDRVGKLAGVDPAFAEEVPLERAQAYIDAAVASRSSKERDELFVSAQEQLKEFLKKTGHARASEARLQLGKLQMVRGAQLLAVKELTDEARKASRDSYLEAATTFRQIVDDLRKTLEDMKGQRIDAEKEPQKAALRDQYRYDFLQAQLRGAEARQMAAKTFANPKTEGKALLEEALKDYRDLSEKYSNYVQGALAMGMRGQVQVELGQTKDAIDSFQRVLEQTDVEPLRPTRMQAITGLIRLWLAESPARIDESIKIGQSFVDSARPNEKRSQELQDLQLELARAYLAKLDKLKAEDKNVNEQKVATTKARQLLVANTKVTGPHETATRELLAKIGIEKPEESEAATVQVKDVTSLDEAMAAAREYLLASEELTKLNELLTSQLKDAEDKAELEKQLESNNQQLAENQLGAILVLRRGLAIGSKDTALVNQALKFLAVSLYQHKQFYEAAVVGQFLSRSAPGDSMGLDGGTVGLSSLQSLLSEADQEQTEAIVKQIEVFSAYIAKTWPDDPLASSSKGIMIQLAIKNERWEEARKLIDAMAPSEDKAKFQRLMGQLVWNRSLMLRQEKKDEEAMALMPQVISDLEAGLNGISSELVAPEAMQSALILAKADLRTGAADKALAALDHPKYGPLKLVDKLGEPSETFKSDLYGAELQAVVGMMTADGQNADALLTRATQTMERLQKSVEGKTDASNRLVRIYYGLAQDIKQQLGVAPPDQKTKLIGAFRAMLESIGASSKDPDTLQWAGQTMLQMGQDMIPPGQTKAQGDAKAMLTTAAKILGDLVKQQGAAASPALKFQMSRAHRLNGEYKAAIDQLVEVLTATPNMLDAQIEGALAYEQWAPELKPAYQAESYDRALRGARPNAKKANIIWGWGKLSNMVSGKEQFRDTFFDARYHVALCRFKQGKASGNNTKLFEQAVKDITQVYALYPDMGGAKKKEEFELLMKEIQKALGQSPVGLPK